MSDLMTNDIPRVGVVETRGIEPVPDAERYGGALELFWTWFGANMGVLGITLGAVLVSFSGLSVLQSIVVAVVGSVGSFLLVGLLSTVGKAGGAPALTLSRAVFGVRGNWAPTLVSWLSFVGWETIMCTTAAYALLAMIHVVGLSTGPIATVICLLAVVAVSAGIGVFGHATIMWIQKWLTWVFGALTVFIGAFLAVKVDWSAVLATSGAPLPAVMGGLGFIAAATGLGWLSAGADYVRYLPRRVPSRNVVAATVAGASVPLVVLISLGALMALTNKDLASANDPVAAIGASLPGWMVIPYLITAVFGLIAAADLSMYSSGLNLITGGIKVRRTTAVTVDAVLITVGGLYMTVITHDFYGPFTTFLTLLAVPLTAWAGVVLVDMTHRPHFDQAGIVDTRAGSTYWYQGGVRWTALTAWIVAIVLALQFTRVQVGHVVWFSGALSGTWFGQNSLGWLIAGTSAAALFWAWGIASARVARQAGEPLESAERGLADE